MDKNMFFQNVGIGIASLTFGVALSIFIYSASTVVHGTSAWFLFTTSFLLMLRFWWRYTTLFVQYFPSQRFWQFVLDFAISFFGILSVLFVKDIRMWTLLIGAAMLASILRCLTGKAAGVVKLAIRRTYFGAIGMLAIMAIAYTVAPMITHNILAGIILALVLVFVIYSAKKQ